MQPDLPDVLVPLGSILDRYGYPALVGMIMVESFGIPAPGQTMLIVAGACAATGRLDLAAVTALAVLAAVTSVGSTSTPCSASRGRTGFRCCSGSPRWSGPWWCAWWSAAGPAATRCRASPDRVWRSSRR